MAATRKTESYAGPALRQLLSQEPRVGRDVLQNGFPNAEPRT
jgi:hypothetical protein